MMSPSSAFSNCDAGISTFLLTPRMSVNCRRRKRTSCASASSRMSSFECAGQVGEQGSRLASHAHLAHGDRAPRWRPRTDEYRPSDACHGKCADVAHPARPPDTAYLCPHELTRIHRHPALAAAPRERQVLLLLRRAARRRELRRRAASPSPPAPSSVTTAEPRPARGSAPAGARRPVARRARSRALPWIVPGIAVMALVAFLIGQRVARRRCRRAQPAGRHAAVPRRHARAGHLQS